MRNSKNFYSVLAICPKIAANSASDSPRINIWALIILACDNMAENRGSNLSAPDGFTWFAAANTKVVEEVPGIASAMMGRKREQRANPTPELEPLKVK